MWVYSDYGIAFDGKGSWSFGNAFARNVAFLVLVIVVHLILIMSRVTLLKKFSINFTKTRTTFCLNLHYNGGDSYFIEIFKFKVNNGNVNFPTQFCLGSTSNGFGATESREVSLKGNAYDFSVDYNATDKSDMLKIHKYLMVKNNIK